MHQIRNYMEELVFNLIPKVLEDVSVCRCNKCKNDIAAIALNNLPPKYVASQKGELYSKLNILQQQFEVDIIAAITKAAAIVRQNPKHDVS